MSPSRRRVVAMMTAALGAAFVVIGRAQSPPELHVMTSGAFTAAHLALAPEFERASGAKVFTDTTTIGTGDTSIEARLTRGETADVVIVDATTLDRFISGGLVVRGTRQDVARSSIGMAVRKGAPKPDISTVEGFRRALLGASSIAYSASVSGVYLTTEVFQSLGIAEQVLPKSRRVVGERVGAVVARGEAEIGFQQMSELMPVPGIDLVGPLPEGIQRVTVFAAGVGTPARQAELARRYIAFLASAAAAPAIERTALEPVAVRVPGPGAGYNRRARGTGPAALSPAS